MIAALAALCGCASEAGHAMPMVMIREAEPLATSKAQREKLCAQVKRDLVFDMFCQGTACDPPEPVVAGDLHAGER